MLPLKDGLRGGGGGGGGGPAAEDMFACRRVDDQDGNSAVVSRADAVCSIGVRFARCVGSD